MTSSSGDKCALFESGMYLLREIKYYSICITREGTKLYVLVKSCLKREKMPLERKQTGLQNSDYPNKRPVTCFQPFVINRNNDHRFLAILLHFGHRLMTELNLNSRLIFCLNNLTSIISK